MFHDRFRPLLFDGIRLPWGDADRAAALIAEHGDALAAVIVEPVVQGAGGLLIQPPGYLRALREAATAAGTYLICDEVATGFGRTGTMFACEQEGVTPDLLCLGKGITGGYLPLAATLATEEIYDRFLGAWRSCAPSSTATPTPAIRLAARQPSPASTCWSRAAWQPRRSVPPSSPRC